MTHILSNSDDCNIYSSMGKSYTFLLQAYSIIFDTSHIFTVEVELKVDSKLVFSGCVFSRNGKKSLNVVLAKLLSELASI